MNTQTMTQEWDDPSEYKKKDNRKWDHNHNIERREKSRNRWAQETKLTGSRK